MMDIASQLRDGGEAYGQFMRKTFMRDAMTTDSNAAPPQAPPQAPQPAPRMGERSAELQRLALYGLFVAYGLYRFVNGLGEDLSSSYLACLLISNGEGAHIYDHDDEYFDVVGAQPWLNVARHAQFFDFFHPYVQTPLWAWSLLPLCKSVSFPVFKFIFLVVALASLAATIEATARVWAPKFLEPIKTAILLLAVSASYPYQYSIWLGQTHALFIFLTVAALLLAEAERPVWAGLLLALACAVKITPGFIFLYWLCGGRGRAALWFAVFSGALLGLTIAAVGWDLTMAYVESMRRVSDVLLVSFNNQSLAAWLGGIGQPLAEVMEWRMFPLSPTLKHASLALLALGVALAGRLSRAPGASGVSASLALICMTIFSPLAWSHYFIILIPAAMVLLNSGERLLVAATIVVLALNIGPLAMDPVGQQSWSVTLIRSHLLSGAIAIAALVWLGWRVLNRKAAPGA